MRSVSLPLTACLLVLTACGGGGGGSGEIAPAPAPAPTSNLTLTLPPSGLAPADLAVVVAEGDPLSEGAGAAYLAARGVPAGNLIRVKVNTGNEIISAADFATLRADIETRLPANIQATLLTWAAPSRVFGGCSMGITSAMAFGFDTRWCTPAVGTCAATAASSYYDSEARRPQAQLQLRPSMLLGPRTLAGAQALIARGVAADATLPAGAAWLVRTSDSQRNVRFSDFSPLPAAWGSAFQVNYLDNSAGSAAADQLADKTGVLVYLTGLANYAGLGSVGLRPGALADTLTSFSGVLAGGTGQASLLDLLAAGATASYGTVEEPCNFQQKFSRASVLIDQYWRGATAIEAYWKAVQWPGQGLFVGEPLAQPFRDAPGFAIVAGEYQIKTRALRPGATYRLQYLVGTTWTTLASFTGLRGQVLDGRAPLAPAAATQIRWQGPCPDNVANSCTLAASS